VVEGAGTGTAPTGMALTGPANPSAADAVVAVPVANVWSEPGAVRPVDRSVVLPRPDIPAWLGAMTQDDRLDLQGRLETQALVGEAVVVLSEGSGWAQVELLSQPSRKGKLGYPGWVRCEHLADAPATAPVAPKAAVSVLHARGQTEGAELVVLSYGTVLPIEGRRGQHLLLRLPGGGLVEVAGAALAPVPAAGAAVLASARTFSGLPYLWGGCSGYGVDCSGLAHLAHRCAGLVIPRDAHDQAGAGEALGTSGAAPGDLLFFARPEEEPHHVALCAGQGRMLHSPGTGRVVEEVSQATEPYRSELQPVARRYASPA
jgi:cell wall-associated NlpC family hydrolase